MDNNVENINKKMIEELNASLNALPHIVGVLNPQDTFFTEKIKKAFDTIHLCGNCLLQYCDITSRLCEKIYDLEADVNALTLEVTHLKDQKKTS